MHDPITPTAQRLALSGGAVYVHFGEGGGSIFLTEAEVMALHKALDDLLYPKGDADSGYPAEFDLGLPSREVPDHGK